MKYTKADLCFQEEKVTKDNSVTLAREYVEAINKVRVIQQKIIPQDPISINDYKISSFYRPSYYASGDFFQYKVIDDEQVAILAVDVIGKGLGASCITVFLKYIFQNIIQTTYSPQEVINLLNEEIFNQIDLDSKACCAFYGVLNTRFESLRYCNLSIGFAKRFSEGSLSYNDLSTIGGLMLGSSNYMSYAEQSINIEKGDTIVIGSDGLKRVKDSSGKRIGSSWLDSLMTSPFSKGISQRPKKDVSQSSVQKIQTALNKKTDYRPFLEDDIFCICIERGTDDNKTGEGNQ